MPLRTWVAHLGEACEFRKMHGGGSACMCREVGERLAGFARMTLGVWVEMRAYMGRLSDMVTGAPNVACSYLKVRVTSAPFGGGMH